MNVISLNKYLSDKELIINSDDLNDFLFSNVRITIEKIVEPVNKKGFLSFAGALNNNDAELLESKIEDCRKIDLSTW